VCLEDGVRWGPEVSQNLRAVRSESTRMLPNSKDDGMIPQINGSIRPESGNTGENFQSDVASVESSYSADKLRFASIIESEINQNLYRNSSSRDSQWRHDNRTTGSTDHCRDNCSQSGDDTTTRCPALAAKSHGVQFQDNSHPGADSKSLKLSNNDCQYSENNCCKLRPDDTALQVPHKTDYLNNLQSSSSQKSVSDCDEVIVNGTSGSSAITDNLPDDIATDDDGVVFDTSDFEVICAMKSEKRPSSRLGEFCAPASCYDGLRWNVGLLDSPHKAQMIRDKYADNDEENLALLEHIVYSDETNRTSMEPVNGEPFSSECREASRISGAVNGHVNLTQRPTNNVQVFSDISDDDDIVPVDKELIPNCSTVAHNNRLLLRQDTIQFANSIAHPAAADEMENVLSRSNVESDTTNRYGGSMEYDDSYEDIVRQNIEDVLRFSAHQNDDEALLQSTSGDKACHSAAIRNSLIDKENEDATPTNTNYTPKQSTNNCNVMHSVTGLPICDSAAALKKNTWDIRRARRRRRKKSEKKTISDVVDLLLKTCGASECSGERTELEFDIEEFCNQNMEKIDEEAILMTLNSNLSEPGSPVDEAPPLLAITDMLEDGTGGPEPTETERRTASASLGYESDDNEMTMPVIEDMRSLLPKEDSAENEVCGNRREEKSELSAPRKVRKTSKPLKRAISTTGKEVLEIERTRSLPVVCDRCTYSCSCEEALHRHIKVCHRISARNNEQVRYVCETCPATSDDRESFLDHLAHHPGQHFVRYYTCSHCGTDGVNMETMQEHVLSSHNGTVLRFEVVQERVSYLHYLMNCPLCGVASRWKKNIVGHIRNYHQMEQLAAYIEHGYRDEPCPDKLSIRKADVMGQAAGTSRRPIAAGNQCQGSNAANSTSRYRDLCETSSSSFNSSMSVVVHICCRCTFSTDDINSYLEHYKGHFSTPEPTRAAVAIAAPRHADQEPRTDQRLLEQPQGKIGGSYVCHLCPFKTPKRMFYYRHMAIHERNSGMTDGYRCGYCQFAHPRIHCIKFHLGRYHGNRPTKVIRISGGHESVIFEDGQDDFEEQETASRSAATPSTYARSGNEQLSSYESLPNSPFSSTATVSKSAPLSVNQTTRDFANDRLKKLNEFERRLPPSMVYEEPVKCPLCSFTNAIRINLIRHLRTHRNDDDEGIGNLVVDDVRGSAVAEFWQDETPDAGGDMQTETAAAEMNMHDTSVPKPRMTQQRIENCLVNYHLFNRSIYRVA